MSTCSKWSKNDQLKRYILRHRACDCEKCGPIEPPIEIELTGIAILAFVSQLAFCKRGAILYYVLFWVAWEAGLYGGARINFSGGKPLCSKNVNYKRRAGVIAVSIAAWLVSREFFCPPPPSLSL